MPVGTFVLTNATAPRSRSTCGSTDSASAGVASLTSAANPRLDGCGGVTKQSFSETGRPCSGPAGRPVRASCASSSVARRSAGANMISVRQFVWGCGSAAGER